MYRNLLFPYSLFGSLRAYCRRSLMVSIRQEVNISVKLSTQYDRWFPTCKEHTFLSKLRVRVHHYPQYQLWIVEQRIAEQQVFAPHVGLDGYRHAIELNLQYFCRLFVKIYAYMHTVYKHTQTLTLSTLECYELIAGDT